MNNNREQVGGFLFFLMAAIMGLCILDWFLYLAQNPPYHDCDECGAKPVRYVIDEDNEKKPGD